MIPISTLTGTHTIENKPSKIFIHCDILFFKFISYQNNKLLCFIIDQPIPINTGPGNKSTKINQLTENNHLLNECRCAYLNPTDNARYVI